MECAPLYIVHRRQVPQPKDITGIEALRFPKTQPPKQPHSSQTLIHERDSSKPRLRRDFIRPGRPLIIEGLGPHLVSLDCGVGRVEAHGETLRAIYIYIYIAILFKHVDGSPVLYSGRM